MTPDNHSSRLDATRRRFLAVSSAAGLGGTLFPGVLLAMVARAEAEAPAAPDLRGWPAITPEMIDGAAALAAVKLTAEQKQMMLDGLLGQRNSVLRVRELHLANSVPPSMVFQPAPAGVAPGAERRTMKLGPAPDAKKVWRDHGLPGEDGTARLGGVSALEGVAFCTVRELAELIRAKKVSSVALTKMYLARLKRYDASLRFVITLTEERALAQAAQADRELAAGHDRGPLHGIPWGAKDLLAVKGYPTTWGAAGFEAQTFAEDAEVVKRLEAAGAVLVAKLSMGALAQGDLWGYPEGSGRPGGRTRNPWNIKQGSSGSSAGSASAVAAGCVGFAIGSETLGSISSPSTRCGVTGLRPSFGLVPRTGAMALSWSMDKLGPIARSVEDAALVLAAIQGPDGADTFARVASFSPDLTRDVRTLRVGYLKSAFDAPAALPAGASAADNRGHEIQAYDARFAAAALDTLRGLGVKLTPCELPDFHFSALLNVLGAEAAAAFDELVTSGRIDLLTGQKASDWPNGLRTSRFLSAVDYIQAQRARTLALAAMHRFFADFDVVVAPSGGAQMTATNLCGQPAVIVPSGLRGADAPAYVPTADEPWPSYGGPGTPVSITFLAPLDAEADACALAHAYQQATGFHLAHPHLG